MLTRFALILTSVTACHAETPAARASGAPAVVSVAAAPASSPELASAPPASASVAVASGQIWAGHYWCHQGDTELLLEINRVQGAEVSAVFTFRYHPSDVSGSYLVEGLFDASSGGLVLAPLRWIEQPANYVMVGLAGRVASGIYRGHVTFDGCRDFQLELSKSPASR